MANGCREELNDVNGQECVADCHQDSHRDVESDDHELSKTGVSVVGVEEVEEDMNQS